MLSLFTLRDKFLSVYPFHIVFAPNSALFSNIKFKKIHPKDKNFSSYSNIFSDFLSCGNYYFLTFHPMAVIFSDDQAWWPSKGLTTFLRPKNPKKASGLHKNKMSSSFSWKYSKKSWLIMKNSLFFYLWSHIILTDILPWYYTFLRGWRGWVDGQPKPD